MRGARPKITRRGFEEESPAGRLGDSGAAATHSFMAATCQHSGADASSPPSPKHWLKAYLQPGTRAACISTASPVQNISQSFTQATEAASRRATELPSAVRMSHSAPVYTCSFFCPDNLCVSSEFFSGLLRLFFHFLINSIMELFVFVCLNIC